MSDQPKTTDVYRIKAVAGGFEAQMMYKCGAARQEEWFPLNPSGYWSDPNGYSFGLISKRYVFESETGAATAIRNAKTIMMGEGNA